MANYLDLGAYFTSLRSLKCTELVVNWFDFWTSFCIGTTHETYFGGFQEILLSYLEDESALASSTAFESIKQSHENKSRSPMPYLLSRHGFNSET